MHVIVQGSAGGVSGEVCASSIVRAALEFATARHAGQCREVDGAPFINHPVEVGRLLETDRQPEEVVAAGLLHDLLEKTATTTPELRRRFGGRVARLVESVSDDPSICDYAARKRELRDRVAHGGPGTVAIFTADKISKARELAQLSPSQLHGPDARAKLDHYVASLEMLRRLDQGGALDDRLDAELTRLVRGVACNSRRAASDAISPRSTAVELS